MNENITNKDTFEENKFKYIFSMKLAGFLMLNGVQICHTERDKFGTGRMIFIFKNTEKVDRLISEYMKLYARRKKDEDKNEN